MRLRSSPLFALMLLPLAAQCTKSPPNLEITEAWMRPMLENGAVFMIINNTGGRSDTLMGAHCECAKAVSLHETRMDGEIMRMVPVDGVAIPGYQRTELLPTGSHLMVEGIIREIRDRSTVVIVLRFERSGDVEVVTEVRRL